MKKYISASLILLALAIMSFGFTSYGQYNPLQETMMDITDKMVTEILGDNRDLPEVTEDQIRATWVSPDGGFWTLSEDDVMSRDDNKGTITFTIEGDILTWHGEEIDGQEYYLKFSEGYQHLFFFSREDNTCALALTRISAVSPGSTLVGNVSEHDARGSLDKVSVGAGCLHIAGWSYDPDTPDISSTFFVTIGGPLGTGVQCGPYAADVQHLGINAVYGVGINHGISETIYTDMTGSQDVYVYTTDYPSGEAVLMGIAQVTIPESLYISARANRIEQNAGEDGGNEGETKVETEGTDADPNTLQETENNFAPEEAASILHWYCASKAIPDGISYIQGEELEDEHTYAVWWRSYTAFTVKYLADLITGNVMECGPYNGWEPEPTLPYSETYVFNLSDYEQYRYYDELNAEENDVKIDN